MFEIEKEERESTSRGVVDLMIMVFVVAAIVFLGYWFFYEYVAKKVVMYFFINSDTFLARCVRNYISCVFAFGLVLVIKNSVLDLYAFAKKVMPIKMFLLAVAILSVVIFAESLPGLLRLFGMIVFIIVVRYGILNDSE